MDTIRSAGAVASILVVDDTPANLKLLTSLLKAQGYKARPVPNGRLALQSARHDPPDLILLDVNMPEMSGYEVCEELQQDDRLRDVPVLFISALGETLDKVKAFQVGGADYVTKPFQFEELEARVKAHLALRRQKRQLQESYENLRQLEASRDSLVHMIVHDLRTPLSAIHAALLTLERWEADRLSATGGELVQGAARSAEHLIDMVTSLLDVSRMEAGEIKLDLSECDLRAVAKETVARLEKLAEGYFLTFVWPEPPVLAVCDRELIGRVLQNLLGNALKYTPAGGRIRLSVERHGPSVRVAVLDTGRGIPEDCRDRIFEKYGQAETRQDGRKYSTGLGLYFCRLAVEAHGGRIGVDSEIGGGSQFWFELPALGTEPRQDQPSAVED